MSGKDLLLGVDGDLVFKEFDLVLTDNIKGLKQRIKRQVLFAAGEWYFNEELGTEYYPVIAGKDLEGLKSVIADSIRSVRSVKDLITFNVTLNSTTRTLNIDFEVIDDLGNVVGDIINTVAR